MYTVADPGFPVGGGRGPVMGGVDLRRRHFTENVCENERIGYRRGGVRRARPPDPPMVHISFTSNGFS